ncbi:MAG: PQQ-binding-like beta-propeller repeat protein [Bacteroidota bacterium]|nr:PQQ-binding-like beta-propeller repeat protein [Bacteroidota bacterium]
MKNLIFFVITIAGGILLTDCSGRKFQTTLRPLPTDIAMYGRVASHEFYDSSVFSFPLKKVWEYDASAGFGTGTPVIIGTTMFFGTLQGELHAINAETGTRIGFFKTFSPVQASPILFHSLLVYATESGKENLVAYRPSDEEEMWVKDLGGVVASPVVADNHLIVGGLNGELVSYDQFGKEEWSVDTKAPIRSSPCAWKDTVFCASTNGIVYAINIEKGEVKWKFSTGTSIYAGLTVANGTVIIASRDSSVYLVEASSGKLMKRIQLRNKIMATPSVSDSTFYVSSLDGLVTAFRLHDGEKIWQFAAKSVINTTPFVTPKAIFIASLDKFLYALSPNDGSIMWKTEIPARIKTTPLVWKNSLYLAAEDKTIYCFRSE